MALYSNTSDTFSPQPLIKRSPIETVCLFTSQFMLVLVYTAQQMYVSDLCRVEIVMQSRCKFPWSANHKSNAI